ncbi:MAG TPA: septum site-determining protein Ssd [Kineosporiaceae bacterium]
MRLSRPVPPSAAPDETRVVLLTRDRGLTDHVRALAEAASAPLEVRSSLSPGERDVSLLLVGLDAAPDLPRGHRGAVLVTRVEGADPPDGLWRRAVEIGAADVVLLPEAEPRLLEVLADAVSPGRRAAVVAVLPGCGGAGASTLAVSLAVTAARGGGCPVIIDADPLGGGLDLALGLDELPGLRWPDVPPGPGRWPPGLVPTGLPEIGGVRVLTGARDDPVPLRPHTVAAAVDAAAREADLVVLDLPRAVGEVEAAVLPGCTQAVVVAVTEIRAAAGASLVASAVARLAPHVRLVVRTRSPAGPAADDVADALGLPLAARVGTDERLAVSLERGEALATAGRGPLAQVCRDLLVDLETPW